MSDTEAPDQMSNKDGMDFVTVVSVGAEDVHSPVKDEGISDSKENENSTQEKRNSGYVTVLQIGKNENSPNEITEEVLVYRLPGERLGFGLKFEGGTKAAEFVKRLFIQSCAPDSPASMVHCSWGKLTEGDEVLNVDSLPVTSMTRIDCVRCLKNSNVVIKLLVRHVNHAVNDKSTDGTDSTERLTEDLPLVISAEKKRTPPPPPPVPPRKIPRKMMKDGNLTQASNSSMDSNSAPLQHNNENTVNGSRNSRFQSPRSSGKFVHPRQSPEVSRRLSRDKCASDGANSGPPDAEVYLDLFSQEPGCNLSESDDTGSSISTIIDRFSSFPTTTNSSFAGSLPSTPTSVQKCLDVANVLDSFEEDDFDTISKDNYLFRKLVSIQSDDDEVDSSSLTRSEGEIIPEFCAKNVETANEESTPLQPPTSFQDAPLSYGNEDVGAVEASVKVSVNESKAHPLILENHVVELEDENGNCLKNISANKMTSRISKAEARKRLPPPPPPIVHDKSSSLIETEIEPDLPRLVKFVPKSNKNVAEHEDKFDNTIKSVKVFLENEIRSWNDEIPLTKNNIIDDSHASEVLPDIYSCSELYNLTWNLSSSQLATIGEDDEEPYQENFTPKISAPAPIVIVENADSDKKDLSEVSEHLEDQVEDVSINDIEAITITEDEEFSVVHSSASSLDANDTMEVPPNCSRQPPDGDEFPDYHETPVCAEVSKTENTASSKPRQLLESTNLWKFSGSSYLYKDQQSSCSVRDKIAIFSNASVQSPNNVTITKKMCKSTDDIFTAVEKDLKSGISHNKVKRSASTVTKSEIFPMVPDRKNTNSPSNSDSISNIKARSSLNLPLLTSRSHCPAEKQSSPALGSDLPPVRLHTRSKSLVDISNSNGNSISQPHKNDRWNLLAEQRQKSLSKLKGLIIPERVVEVDVPTMIDLPEIKSNDSPVSNSKSMPASALETPIIPCQRNLYNTPCLTTPPWDTNNTINVPKYSPAFKRKSLQVHSNGTIAYQTNSPPSVPSATDESEVPLMKLDQKQQSLSNQELSSEPKICGGLCLGDAPKSLESITSPTRSDCSFEYLNSSSPDVVKPCKQEPAHRIFQIDTRIGPYSLHREKEDVGRSEDESDNDSAVSSSQSSYISRTSPPMSPNHFHGNFSSRTCSINESDAVVQLKCHSTGSPPHCQSGDNQNHRLLKPQSVEAINRKNILASAKCRSGRDLKIGSPLIQRRFEEQAAINGDASAVQMNAHGNDYNHPKYVLRHSTIYETSGPASLKPDNDIVQAEDFAKEEICSTPNKETATQMPKLVPADSVPVVTKEENLPSAKKSSRETMPLNNSNVASDRERRVPIPKKLNKNACTASVTDLRKNFEKLAPVSPTVNPPTTTPNKNNVLSPVQNNNHNEKSKNTDNAQPHVPKREENVKPVKSVTSEPISGDVQIIVLRPEIPGGSIGITLAGGVDYETKEITVHKIREDSSAHRDGRLQKGDKITSINGKSVDGLTHSQLVALLKEPLPEVTLAVCRSKKQTRALSAQNNPPTSASSKLKAEPVLTSHKPQGSTSVVQLVKDISGLGFSLEGGQDSLLGNMPLLIKKIFKGGAAEKNGNLRVGDEILMVNEKDVSSMSRFEVWSILKKLPEGVGISLIIRR